MAGVHGSKSEGFSSSLKVRSWANKLLDRSLLLGSMNHGLKIHDLVLDHMRSQFAKNDLRDAHCRVSSALIAFCKRPQSLQMAEVGRESVLAYSRQTLDFHVHAALLPKSWRPRVTRRREASISRTVPMASRRCPAWSRH